MIKILLIEDNEPISGLWQARLKKYVNSAVIAILLADSLQGAEEKFRTNPDIGLIVIDGRVIGPHGTPSGVEEPNTLDLVSEFKKTFDGPMIAASDKNSNIALMARGCTHQCVETKAEVPGIIEEILHLTEKETSKTPSI